MKQVLRLTNFGGGLSDDDKFGPPNSFSEGQAINFRLSPGLLTIGRKAVKESSTTVDRFIHDMVRVSGGTIYAVGGLDGETGKLYKRTPGSNGAAGTWSVVESDITFDASGTVRDIDYRRDLDAMFLYGSVGIHEYSPISGTPAFDDNKYTIYVDSNTVSAGGTYTLPTSLTEADKVSFTANVDPIRKIRFNVDTKTTGNWTIVVHNGANQSIATATILQASVPASGEIDFEIDARLKLDATYHVHIYASAAGNKITSTAANTLPLASIAIIGGRLVNAGEFGHRTMQYGALTLICNERYLAEWEILDTTSDSTTGFDPHRLVFPPECKTNGLAIYSEYVAISAAKEGSSDSLNLESTEGVIFFWDGVSDFYSFALDVPQGVPRGMFAANNALYWEANGRWYRWSGGEIEVIFEFPGVDDFQAITNGPSTEIYLRAARHCMAQSSEGNQVLIGFPQQTANFNTKIGLFSHGQNKSFMPVAFGYDALISTGNHEPQADTSTNPDTPVTGITCLKRFGSNILMAWRDRVGGATVYGVDFINDTAAPATQGKWASLWFDNGTPDKEKTPIALKIVFETALPENTDLKPRIRYDGGDWIIGATAVAGTRESVFHLDNLSEHPRFYEVMFGFDMTNTAGVKPAVRSISFKFDDNEEEDISTEAARGV